MRCSLLLQDLSELGDLLYDHEVLALQASKHPVVDILSMITDLIDSVSDQLPLAVTINFEAQMSALIMDVQSCTRIVGTPMPFAYVVHLRCVGVAGSAWATHMSDRLCCPVLHRMRAGSKQALTDGAIKPVHAF